MTPAPSSALLRAGARGIPAEQAAIDLLIAHDRWLRRADFTRFVDVVHSAVDPDLSIAVLDWPAAISALDAGELPCSAGERRILRVAASLADHALIHLGDTVTSLDHANTQIVVRAIEYASSHG